jgi:hypothetical protein
MIGSRDVGARVRWVASEGSLVLLVAVRTAVRWPSDLLEGRSVRGIAVGWMVVAFPAHAVC